MMRRWVWTAVYVPNLVCYLRLALLFQNSPLLNLASIALDPLDGWLARTLSQTSSFGMILDQVCDIAFHTSNFLFAFKFNDFPNLTSFSKFGLAFELFCALLVISSSLLPSSHWKDHMKQGNSDFCQRFLALYFSNQQRNLLSAFANIGHVMFPYCVAAFRKFSKQKTYREVFRNLVFISFLANCIYWKATLLMTFQLLKRGLASTSIKPVDLLVFVLLVIPTPQILFKTIRDPLSMSFASRFIWFRLMLFSCIILLRKAQTIQWDNKIVQAVMTGSDMYFLFLQVLLYVELNQVLGMLYKPMKCHDNNQIIYRLESFLLNGMPCQYLREATPLSIRKLLGELLHIAYLCMYPICILSFWAFFLEGNTRSPKGFPFSGRDSMVLHFAASWSICYVIYLVFPVSGPLFSVPRADPNQSGFWISHMVKRIGDKGASTGTAFPSSHCAIAVSLALANWRYQRSFNFLLFHLIAAPSLVFSTVWTGYHYALDAIAGTLAGWLGGIIVESLASYVVQIRNLDSKLHE
jgi:membrane-associated phospholipid phosphatase